MKNHVLRACFVAAWVCACSPSDAPESPQLAPSADGGLDDAHVPSEQERADLAVRAMYTALLASINDLHQASLDLQNAAPLPSGRGWDAVEDATAISAMQAAWVRARYAYEKIEGAIAPIFPDVDASIDARYDDFLTQLVAVGGDANPFDDSGVTGLHAVERVLYSPTTPDRVITFEKALPGYMPARFPATESEASDFKTKLCAKVVADAALIRDLWTPETINGAAAFHGLISLMNEQHEKVNKAASNEEESRYSQRTMADLRGNLEGTRIAYAVFQPWILSRSGEAGVDGPALDREILSGFDALDEAYRKVTGDAIPEPPATWSAESPSAADLATPFGQLYTRVGAEVDPNSSTSVVSKMNLAAALLRLDTFETK